MRLGDADVVGHVAVYRQKVEQTIQVVIKEKSAEGKRLQRPTVDASRLGRGRVQARTIRVVQRHTLIGEVTDRHSRMAGVFIVPVIHSHAGTGGAGVTVGDAGLHGNVGESAVVVVAIELVRLRVVGYQQIKPAIIVVIQQRNAERLAAWIV